MKLTANRLRELLYYDPETGEFTWLTRPSTCVHVGQRAGGTSSSHGYRRIRADHELYSEHQLAWLYMTGNWPDSDIDHVNGKRADNKWRNLRLADRSLNMQNLKGPHRDNSTGFLGVHKHRKSYRAEIMISGEKVRLGGFETAEEAHKSYLAAKRELHPGNTL